MTHELLGSIISGTVTFTLLALTFWAISAIGKTTRQHPSRRRERD